MSDRLGAATEPLLSTPDAKTKGAYWLMTPELGLRRLNSRLSSGSVRIASPGVSAL
jgi:hypothetical protein